MLRRQALHRNTIYLLILLVLGCNKQSVPASRPDIVLIVVDTLRADHLGCYGYTRNTSPSIDALAAESVRFAYAYSTSSWTKPAIASIFTGLYPSRHGVDGMLQVLPPSAGALAERLAEHGYQTAGVISHSLLGEKFGFDQGFEHYDESQAKGHNHVSTNEVSQRAVDLVHRLSTNERPYFLFVHLFDPHDTYRPHPGIEFAPASAGRVSAGRPSPPLRQLTPPLDESEIQLLRDVYDEEIRLTDDGIGRILEALSGRLDRTLVLLTADHGEEFMERGWLGHGTSLFDEVLRVPLLIRAPGSDAGSVEQTPVSTAGVAATILAFAGITSTGDPHDVGPLIGPSAVHRPVHAELNYAPRAWKERPATGNAPWLRTVIDGRHKLVLDSSRDTALLFDLATDPHETRNLAKTKPEHVARLRKLIREAENRPHERRLRSTSTGLSEAEKETLRQLGYGD